MHRGYPKHLILKALEHTEHLERETLLNKETLKENTSEHENKKFYYVTCHSPLNSPIKEIITTNWENLGKPKTTRQLLESEIIFGLRRNKNLSDHASLH